MTWRTAHRERVERLEAEAADVLLGALGPVVDRVADRLGAVTAAAGEPQASPDDLAAIQAEWRTMVDQVVLPYFGGIFTDGVQAADAQLRGIGIVVPAPDPELVDMAAARYLSEATDRFYGLGAEAWDKARAELLAGFRAGEGIGELRTRVAAATGLVKARAEAIARTEVIAASNLGADARINMLGADAPPYKQWLSTMDGRTRPSHVAADGQVVARTDRFAVGASHLRVPGDPTGPAEEVINCRCTVLYLDSPDPLDLDGRQEGGIVDQVAVAAAAGPPQVDTTTGEPHTGSMVALVPADPDQWVLPVDGAEPGTALHLTLGYLGDADLIPPAARQTLMATMEALAGRTAPIEARAFGASLWNTTGDTPSLNLAIGGDGLQQLHDAVWVDVARAGVAGGPEALWGPPAQHQPWVAHVCLLYADPVEGLSEFFQAAQAAATQEGPIVFDKLRLTFGSEAHDFDLGGGPIAEVSASASMSTDGAMVAPDAQPQEAAMPWEIREGGPDCPYEVVKEGTDERAGCHDTEAAAQAQVDALYAAEADMAANPPPEPQPGEHLRARMHTQGTPTGGGDTGRVLVNTTYRETPFAFHWSKAASAHGGQPVVVHVGNVVRVVPGAGPGQPDYGFVQLDLESVDGAEYARRVVAGFDRWVSIGLDETKPTITMEFPDEPAEGMDDDEAIARMLFEEPDRVRIDGGRVAELTGVSVPAQADAEVEPTPELVALMADPADDEPAPVAASAVRLPADRLPAVPARAQEGPPAVDHEPTMADTVQALTAAAYTITIPDLPPAWWYDEPTDVDLTEGAFNLTDEGRIYGALAPLGVNHRAFARAGRRQEAPTSRVDYSRFMGGWAMTVSGRVPAGPVTMDCGHAPIYRPNAKVGPAHYDNACTVVAKIAVGVNHDRRVVWAAGALEPGVTVDQVSRMLACRLSGDWQPHSDKRGWTELIAALLVPSPGFPMAHGASVKFEGEALVASSVPVRAVGAKGRPRLRVDLASRSVDRVAMATPAERFRRVIADVQAGRPVARRKKGCC